MELIRCEVQWAGTYESSDLRVVLHALLGDLRYLSVSTGQNKIWLENHQSIEKNY